MIKEHEIIKLSTGDVITIDKYDYPFFEKIYELPLNIKMELFDINFSELNNYLNVTREKLINKLKFYLNQKWFDNDNGYKMLFNDKEINEDIFGIKLNFYEIKQKIRRNSISNLELEILIDFFQNTTDFYYKEHDNN
jgi:hypothetical protein